MLLWRRLSQVLRFHPASSQQIGVTLCGAAVDMGAHKVQVVTLVPSRKHSV